MPIHINMVSDPPDQLLPPPYTKPSTRSITPINKKQNPLVSDLFKRFLTKTKGLT